MKILIVGQAHSIHIGRWINQFTNKDWDMYLFSILDLGTSSYILKTGTIFHTFYSPKQNRNKAKNIGVPIPFLSLGIVLRKILSKLIPNYQKMYLSFVIWYVRPDIIHSVGHISHYLVEEIKKEWKGKFPQWVVMNWGHDLFLMGKLSTHNQTIKDAISQCDSYVCECKRDIKLASQFGLKNNIPTYVIPCMGGYNLRRIASIRSKVKTSKRKIILLKGYQHWIGRCLVGLEALKRCKSFLKDYTVIVYAVGDAAVELAVNVFSKETGIAIKIFPYNTSHEKILKLHSSARISIGLSISDGISASFLEAIACGSFPIQSNTSCANEWIENQKTGILVSPEDPASIAKAIKIALNNDTLVDFASLKNWETVQKRAGNDLIKSRSYAMYNFTTTTKNV